MRSQKSTGCANRDRILSRAIHTDILHSPELQLLPSDISFEETPVTIVAAGKYLSRCDMAQDRSMEDNGETQSSGSASECSEESKLDATGVYETAGEVVLYDTERPLAWIEADNAVELAEMI